MRGTTLAAALIALSIPAVRQAEAQASADTSAATSPGAERAAGELLHVMHLDDQWPALVAAQMDQVITNNPQMAPFKGTMTAFFVKYAGWQAMEPAMQHLYAQQFTEAELRNMIAFYSTPTGQKATSKLAVLQARGAEIGQQAVAAHKDELTAAIMLRAQQIKDSSAGTPTVWTKPSP
jgi:uncharacterized protein